MSQISLEPPSIFGPHHVVGHIRQNGELIHQLDGNKSLGCLDPSQPFTIEIDNINPIVARSFYFRINNNRNAPLIKVYELSESLIESGDGSFSLVLNFDSIPMVNCEDYGNTTILTLSFHPTPDVSNLHATEYIEIKVKLCCDENLRNFNDSVQTNSFYYNKNNTLKIKPNLSEGEEWDVNSYKVFLFDIFGNLHYSGQSDNLNNLDLPDINDIGVYILVINGINNPFRFSQKIIISE